MLLLDLYMTNEMLLHDPKDVEIYLGDVDTSFRPNDPREWVYYGEPGVYPQFAIAEAESGPNGM